MPTLGEGIIGRMPGHELADFEPSDGHLHSCARAGYCDCAVLLYELATPEPCCNLHQPAGCCDPNDCGPCCENCPTCPTLMRSRALDRLAVGLDMPPELRALMLAPTFPEQVATLSEPRCSMHPADLCDPAGLPCVECPIATGDGLRHRAEADEGAASGLLRGMSEAANAIRNDHGRRPELPAGPVTRIDQILGVIDGHAQSTTEPGFRDDEDGEVFDSAWCARCLGEPKAEGGEMCEGCRAFLLGDSDHDPAADEPEHPLVAYSRAGMPYCSGWPIPRENFAELAGSGRPREAASRLDSLMASMTATLWTMNGGTPSGLLLPSSPRFGVAEALADAASWAAMLGEEPALRPLQLPEREPEPQTTCWPPNEWVRADFGRLDLGSRFVFDTEPLLPTRRGGIVSRGVISSEEPEEEPAPRRFDWSSLR